MRWMGYLNWLWDEEGVEGGVAIDLIDFLHDSA